MKREFSAGGIVVLKNSNPDKFLLIKNAQLKDPTKSYWGFPKGHIDSGESSKDAAIREIKEETGVDAQILEKIGDSKYVFEWQGEKIFKVVVMFLMEATNEETKIQVEEIDEAGWYSFDEALKMLSFSNDKNLLRVAREKLESHGDSTQNLDPHKMGDKSLLKKTQELLNGK